MSTGHEDDPGQSSAALCISLELLGESFSPEFTHQCFPGEWIRGYLPKTKTDSTRTRTQHSTHVHHEKATNELEIQVKLSPSCCQSQVNVQVHRKPIEIVTRVSKRPRLMNKEDTQGTVAVASDDEEDEQVSRDTVVSPDEKDGDSDYLLTEEEESEEPNCANAGTTRTRRMPVDEIMERCGKALPTRVQHLNEDDFLKEPIGTILHEYQRNKLRFVISLADGCNAVEYHNQVQTLATWFIETADTVNVASRDGGYWKVLYLFRRNAPHQYSLAGYLTIFHFLSPFKRPKSGIVARVCQALILPPYQRMGHGKMLLKTVYELAADSSKNIVEINVEDPAPSFVALRNGVDIPRIHAQQKSVARYHLHDSRRSRRGLFSRSCRQGCHCGWSRGTHYAATSANLPRTLQTVPREQS